MFVTSSATPACHSRTSTATPTRGALRGEPCRGLQATSTRRRTRGTRHHYCDLVKSTLVVEGIKDGSAGCQNGIPSDPSFSRFCRYAMSYRSMPQPCCCLCWLLNRCCSARCCCACVSGNSCLISGTNPRYCSTRCANSGESSRRRIRLTNF